MERDPETGEPWLQVEIPRVEVQRSAFSVGISVASVLHPAPLYRGPASTPRGTCSRARPVALWLQLQGARVFPIVGRGAIISIPHDVPRTDLKVLMY